MARDDLETSTIQQACAVPFRMREGHPEYCLITSTAGRWHFPKGYIDDGETLAEAALKEAYEEAGLHGRVIGKPIGSFEIIKNGQLMNVVALLMEVDQCDSDWKESHFRERRWVSAKEAKKLLAEDELIALLQSANTRLRAA